MAAALPATADVQAPFAGCTVVLTAAEQTASCSYTATGPGRYSVGVAAPWLISTADGTVLVSGQGPAAGLLATIGGEEVTVTVGGSPAVGATGIVSVGDQ